MIRNASLMSQIVDFKGMEYGRCRPTDLDLSIDFSGEVFIFTELKYKGVGLTIGQSIHMMGLVNGLEAGGRKAYAILAHHKTPEGESIVAAEAVPKRIYYEGVWTECTSDTLHEVYEEIHQRYRLSKVANPE